MRFEIKSSYPPYFDSQLLAWVKSHAMGFRVAYPARRVNNVYFDTIDLRALQENIAGISERCKVRYRWYGHDELPGPGTLEFKNKRTALGWKDNFRIEESPYASGDNWRAFQRKLRHALPPAARVMFDEHGEVALINKYDRRYFESRDGRVRITLDSNQTMFDQMRSARPNITRRFNLPGVNILEVKCEDTDHEAAVRALADCPVRIARFSKYTAGSGLRD